MDRKAAGSSSSKGSKRSGKAGNKTKESKSSSSREAKKQQESHLAAVGSQFWQSGSKQETSGSDDYPSQLKLD
ncbi:Uu.00g118640.m01.CDS01 [Anthostomella pinea]|uniref:Uu.00g118640.m01.CDS01 n=1 Tax=Anthostomella pinea TaxID=933095 RepID=A0AAI8YGY6_9PEZI|nr:Uu.00g118640.m01.CDS01 [Anthostomella pinea]